MVNYDLEASLSQNKSFIPRLLLAKVLHHSNRTTPQQELPVICILNNFKMNFIYRGRGAAHVCRALGTEVSGELEGGTGHSLRHLISPVRALQSVWFFWT